jgi:hypothetical protein
LFNKAFACASRVELLDGSYTLVPKCAEEGADGGMNYVEVNQNLDQSPEEPNASFADEGKPQSIT